MWLSAALSELDAAANITSERGSGGKSRPMIYEMCDEMISSRGTSPLLSDFAKHYGYSEAYLGKLFRKTVGVEFSGYVINARINKAKILLRSSGLYGERNSGASRLLRRMLFCKTVHKNDGNDAGKVQKVIKITKKTVAGKAKTDAWLQICELFFTSIAICKKACIIDNREIWDLSLTSFYRP